MKIDYRELITLADISLLNELINEYGEQSRQIKAKGGHPGYSQNMESRLITLRNKLLTGQVS